MKRFFIFFCFFIFILTGCNSKNANGTHVLECDSSATIGNSISEQNFKIHFIKDKISMLSVNINVSFNEQDNITRDNLEKDVSDAFDDYKNRKGITYLSSVNDNGFNVKLDIDFNKLSEDDRNSINLINSEKTYDEIKIELENNGFVCK